jgi:uncharacterized cupredoxin-like copper-binding protein
LRLGLLVGVVLLAAGCVGGPATTPPISPGSSASPRDVNIIAKDYSFLPPEVDLVPGETVMLHVINGGLDVHEVVIGDSAVQDAWETAEAAAANPPPGPTPLVTVPAGTAGVRIVVQSGQRVDLLWTVPADPGALLIGCHIPGHWAKGMQASIRFVAPNDAGGPGSPSTQP